MHPDSAIKAFFFLRKDFISRIGVSCTQKKRPIDFFKPDPMLKHKMDALSFEATRATLLSRVC